MDNVSKGPEGGIKRGRTMVWKGHENEANMIGSTFRISGTAQG